MSKANTKATIDANIKQNGNQEITGQILNSVLNTMVDDYGEQEKLTELQGETNNLYAINTSFWGGESLSVSSTINNYYIDNNGILVSAYGYIVKIFDISNFDKVYIDKIVGGVACGVLCDDADDIIGSMTQLLPQLSSVSSVINNNGSHYIAVNTYPSYAPNDVNVMGVALTYNGKTEKEIENATFRFVELDVIKSLLNKYITNEGVLADADGYIVKVVNVTNLKSISINKTIGMVACGVFCTDINDVIGTKISVIPQITDLPSEISVPSGALYFAFNTYPSYAPNDVRVSAEENVFDYAIKMKGKFIESPYKGKKCMYVGDSISTDDNCYWKGLLKSYYGLDYVVGDGEVEPARGGINITPVSGDGATERWASIWWRIANHRLMRYDCDVISLFGGTNDMATYFDETYGFHLGTKDDMPYVDDSSTFPQGTTTDVKPTNLTFASAFKGCILMLQRDFPGKEIFIPTVMPCDGTYGNWIEPTTNKKCSEAIARLQVEIAELYQLKCIPFYWMVRDADNVDIFSADGVHPNYQCALKMQGAVANILGMR